MKTNHYTNTKSRYVIEGNNVRKLNHESNPHSYEESMSDWLEKRERAERQKRSNEARKRRLQREQEKRMELTTFIVLTGAVLFTFYVCLSYLNVRSDVTNTSKKIAALENEIISIQDANQLALERVEDDVDLSEVYKIATEELGMVHPSAEQIIEYEQVKSDYLKQYSDIPETKEDNLIKKIIEKVKSNLG